MREKAKVIAEIGCNHMGDMRVAKSMIDSAASTGVYGVKFQKRNNKELLSYDQYNAPHPNPRNSYGDTYGEHREFLEFTQEQHKELKAHCELRGVVYSCSVWDMTSAKEIVELRPKMIKVPSATNSNIDLLEYLFNNSRAEIHISLGMTTLGERREIERVASGNLYRTVYYACTSGYPVKPEECYLFEILKLPACYRIGYSGHHLGTAIDVAAYALGAWYIERHFTHNKYFKGTDHSASLEVSELERLVNNLEDVYHALNYRTTDISKVEEANREKLKWGL